MLAQVALFHGSSPVNQCFRLVAVGPNVTCRQISRAPLSTFLSLSLTRKGVDFAEVRIDDYTRFKVHLGLEIKSTLIPFAPTRKLGTKRTK